MITTMRSVFDLLANGAQESGLPANALCTELPGRGEGSTPLNGGERAEGEGQKWREIQIGREMLSLPRLVTFGEKNSKTSILFAKATQ